MRHIFLSDVHIGAFSEKTEELIEADLLSLIDYCEDEKIQIHILGDLFDYWMEYPNRTPELGKRVLNRFKQYNQAMEGTLYITGNHDNWTRNYFSEVGFDIEHDYRSLAIGDLHIFVHHGDGVSDPSVKLARPLFHRVLRHPLFVKFYQALLPFDAGIDLMKRFSMQSKADHVIDPEPLNHWAGNFLKSTDYSVVICGHDHIPRMETFSHGIYINCGAFCLDRTLVLYNNNNFEIVKWNGSKLIYNPI